MITMSPSLASAIVAHFAGDYLLQNDWIAKNKKTNSIVCALHALAYTAVIMVMTIWPAWCVIPVLLSHFIIDRWSLASKYMNVSGQKKFKLDYAPWSTIVIDNTMHLMVLWAVALYV